MDSTTIHLVNCTALKRVLNFRRNTQKNICKFKHICLWILVAGDSAICGRLRPWFCDCGLCVCDLSSSDHLSKGRVGLAILKSQPERELVCDVGAGWRVYVVRKHSPGRSPQSCPSGDFSPFSAEMVQNDFLSICRVENSVFRETEKHALDHFFWSSRILTSFGNQFHPQSVPRTLFRTKKMFKKFLFSENSMKWSFESVDQNFDMIWRRKLPLFAFWERRFQRSFEGPPTASWHVRKPSDLFFGECKFSWCLRSGAKTLSSKMLSVGSFEQFQHFQRKFNRFEFFWPFAKSRNAFREKNGECTLNCSMIFQNLNSIPKSIVKTCCERTSFSTFFRRKILGRKKIPKCPVCSLYDEAAKEQKFSFRSLQRQVGLFSAGESAFAPLASKQREEAPQVADLFVVEKFDVRHKHPLWISGLEFEFLRETGQQWSNLGDIFVLQPNFWCCHKHSLQILDLEFEFFERNRTVMEFGWKTVKSNSAQALLLRSVVSFSQCLRVFETFVCGVRKSFGELLLPICFLVRNNFKCFLSVSSANEHRSTAFCWFLTVSSSISTTQTRLRHHSVVPVIASETWFVTLWGKESAEHPLLRPTEQATQVFSSSMTSGSTGTSRRWT